MNTTVIWVLILVVALIVGPFATLRAVSHYKTRKATRAAPPKPDDEDDPDKPKGFW